MKIKLFAYDFTNDNFGYRAIGPNEDASGEYVPLSDHQALRTHMESLAKETYQLKGLIRRVINIGPEIYDNWDDVEGWKSDRLTQLLEDCREAL